MRRKTKKPAKDRKNKGLSREDKIDIIIEEMIENPGAHQRRGFQKHVIDVIKAKYDIKVDKSYMAKMMKVAITRIGQEDRYFMSKREYQLQYQRLLVELKKTQDKVLMTIGVDKIDNLTPEEKERVKERLREFVRETTTLTDTQRKMIREMAQLDGHLKDTHVHEFGDSEKGKSIEEYYDGKTNGKNKKGGDQK
jgi:hypothetical protein